MSVCDPMTICVTYKMDDDGNPIECPDILEWAKWFNETDRSIADNKIGKVRISTIFNGTPLMNSDSNDFFFFETVIFGGDKKSTIIIMGAITNILAKTIYSCGIKEYDEFFICFKNDVISCLEESKKQGLH